MPGRIFNLGGYRYGFNGKENDNEVKGPGNSIDFGERIYDPRIGKFLSVDASERNYPSISPYAFSFNNPVLYNDPDGNDPIITVKSSNSKLIKGVTVINIVIDVTLKGKIVSNTSNRNFDGRMTAAQTNINGGKILSGTGTVNSQEMFKFDGKGGTFSKPSKVQINYTINVNVDFESTNNINGITKGDDVVLFQDNLSKFTTNTKAQGINTHVGVAGAIPDTKGRAKRDAHTALHETMHTYGLGDEYRTDANGNITYSAYGNTMGADQDIDRTSITPEQRGEFVLSILKIRESMKKNKTDYNGITGRDARKETKKKLN